MVLELMTTGAIFLYTVGNGLSYALGKESIQTWSDERLEKYHQWGDASKLEKLSYVLLPTLYANTQLEKKRRAGLKVSEPHYLP